MVKPMISPQQKLANEIYEWLLNTNQFNKQIAELKWVTELSVVDTALLVIQIWLQSNDFIEDMDDYFDYIEVMSDEEKPLQKDYA